MSLMNQTRLSEIGCCINSKLSDDINDSWKGKTFTACATIDAYKYSILRSYVPNGTELVEGFVASATLDMSAFSAFGSLLGDVVINGVVVGIIPDGTYADIDALIDAYVTAIEANPIGYQAVNNGDGTITVSAPNQGSQANGFVITIQINPTFVRLSQIDYDNREWRQPIHINDQSSALFGHTIIAARASGGVNPFYLEDIFDHAIVQTVDVDYNAGAAGLVHRPDDDTIFVGAFQGSGRLRQFVNTFASSQQITLSGVNGINWAVYNTFNNCLYFAAPSANNKVVKVDPTGVQTLISSITGVIKLAVDDSTGTVWAVGTNSLWRINPTTNVATAIPTVGEVPVSISYCNAGSGSMFVAFSTPSVVRRYNLDGTVLTSTFYSLASLSAVIYSSVFNVVFAGTSSITHVIKMDGTLKNTIADGSENYVEDIARSEVIGFRDSGLGNIGYVNFFGLGTDGTDVFDGALEDGVDPVLMEQEDQCLTEAQVSGAYQYLDKECGMCGGATYSGGAVLPPVIGTSVIYYGISTNAALDAAGVAALTSVTQSSIAGTYTYALGGATNYIYFAYPTSLGIPVRMYDPAGFGDIIMQASYQVIINYVTYTVYRSSNQLGGGFDMIVTI
jgi:hypothetical protein